MTTPNTYDVEARSYELDAYGHVNNAVHVSWLEHGRLCFLRDRGLTYTSIPEEYGVHVVVVHQEVSYRAQVALGDQLKVVSAIERFGRSSFVFAHRIEYEDGRLAADGRVTMVCVGPDGASFAMPDGLRARLDV